MKHIENINEWFGKQKDGDEVAHRILDITKEEKIPIRNTGGYRIEIDNRIYSFSKFSYSDCSLSVYDKSQEVMTKYGLMILDEPKSHYQISRKIWKELENLYKIQSKNLTIDLDYLDDTRRTAKKYNL